MLKGAELRLKRVSRGRLLRREERKKGVSFKGRVGWSFRKWNKFIGCPAIWRSAYAASVYFDLPLLTMFIIWCFFLFLLSFSLSLPSPYFPKIHINNRYLKLLLCKIHRSEFKIRFEFFGWIIRYVCDIISAIAQFNWKTHADSKFEPKYLIWIQFRVTIIDTNLSFHPNHLSATIIRVLLNCKERNTNWCFQLHLFFSNFDDAFSFQHNDFFVVLGDLTSFVIITLVKL